MSSPLVVTFIGGSRGVRQIREIRAIAGPSLPAAERLDIVEGGDRVQRWTQLTPPQGMPNGE